MAARAKCSNIPTARLDGRLLLGHNVVTKEHRYVLDPRMHAASGDRRYGSLSSPLDGATGGLASRMPKMHGLFASITSTITGWPPIWREFALQPSAPLVLLNIDART